MPGPRTAATIIPDLMSEESADPFVLLPRATQNSRVVRELDPRASRNLWLLLSLGAAIVQVCRAEVVRSDSGGVVRS